MSAFMDQAISTRPRNIGWKRAAALLYGDWGTSKAYVTGIAFAIAMYGSFWFVLAISLLTALVGLNYIWICKYFPDGGGVYSSAKAQSRYLALIGGFLLVADYIVTASLSCYDAYLYLGFEYNDAKRWAILTIFVIGCVNFFGPRHSGSIAVLQALATVVVIGLLAVACVPHLPAAVANLQPPHRDPLHWWGSFVGVVLALSGVEAIANMTGLMHLDPGSTPAKPQVQGTARRAILVVMVEVCVLTVLFGLAMNAIPGMGARDHEGDMLRYMAQVFVDQPLQHFPGIGWLGAQNAFSWLVSVVLGILLLSAVNTAMGALVSIQYMMARDDELPQPFTMLNRFGVPWIVLLIAMFGPILVIDVQGSADALHGLADMYGIGVVGAIAVNLGSTAFNSRLPMMRRERSIMMITFLLLAAIEITIAVTKPHAAIFAGAVLVLGFGARAMHKGFAFELPVTIGRLARVLSPAALARRQAELPAEETQSIRTQQLGPERPVTAIMVAARGVTPTLRFAVDLARAHHAALHVLFVREHFTTIPVPNPEESDPEAQAVFAAVKDIAADVDVATAYAVSDDPAWLILDHAAIAGVDTLIIGHSRRWALTQLLRGNLVRRLARQLPEEIRLVIVG
jgi:amino acid transporter/nucleotide-binding universal stress UspA family protein